MTRSSQKELRVFFYTSISSVLELKLLLTLFVTVSSSRIWRDVEPVLGGFCHKLQRFRFNNRKTQCVFRSYSGQVIPVFINEFWTSKQRAAHSLHEISYRACFKPQLPRFFIERLTKAGDLVYDPFMGRGTTVLEANLLGRKSLGCDINSVSARLIEPRLKVTDYESVEKRLNSLEWRAYQGKFDESLLTFYHPNTLEKLLALRRYLHQQEECGTIDYVDSWIRMVATNRLTGHSAGFFSVYTLPPNQAVSIESQKRINARRNQVPPHRDVAGLILKKTRSLLRDLTDLQRDTLEAIAQETALITGNCADTPQILDESVQLVVTSPPFLDVVNYQQDNWLRCWFNRIDSSQIPIWQLKSESDWVAVMKPVFAELFRILKPGGFVAFEVGEVRNGKVKMESLVLDAATGSGLLPQCIMINQQDFTKTANCWGVSNRVKGTNTNRIVIFSKPES